MHRSVVGQLIGQSSLSGRLFNCPMFGAYRPRSASGAVSGAMRCMLLLSLVVEAA